MADYYWVGGTGNWSDFATRWATSSGGGIFHTQAPTSADNVIFDDNSAAGTFTVTVNATSNCANFSVTITNAAKKMTLAGSSALGVYGSWINATSTYYASTYTGALTFRSTTTGNTITTNSVSVTTGTLSLDGVSGEWTLGSALTTGAGITLTNGSFITANFNVTATVISSTSTNIRNLSLGSSTVALSSGTPLTITSTNLTFNAGTSQINCSNGNPSCSMGGLTYYNVSFTSNFITGLAIITGANTFNNLVFTTASAAGMKFVRFAADQTVNGTLTFGAANTAVRRMLVFSDVVGTQRTITLNGTLSALADVDFRDIKAAGSVATPWTGTRLGNCLGNDNTTITFAAGVNKYWYTAAGTGGNWSDAAWETTAGGTTPALNNFPLAQDTVIIQATGLNDGATITINGQFQIGSLNMSARNSAAADMTLATGTTTPTFYGSLTYGSNVATSGTGAFTFAGQGVTQTLTSAAVTFTQPFTISNATGTLTLADNTSLSGTALATTLTSGTFNVNGKTFTTGTFVATGALTRAITFGTNGKIVIAGSGATAWSASGSGLTTTGTTSTISMTSASAKTFAGGGFNYAATLSQDGAGALTISGSNTFANIANTTQPVTITFTAGTTQTVSSFTASGTSGNLVTLQSSSAGSRFTLSDSSGTNTVSYCSIKDSIATGGAT